MAIGWSFWSFCLLSLFGGSQAAVECQPNLEGYTFINYGTEVCFQFVYEVASRRSWSDAQQYCQDRGGRLVNIDSANKQDQMEKFMNLSDNSYKPENYRAPYYDALDSSTWGDYDPDVWLGASRDSDGVTWRFDTYATSHTSRSSILLWFNYGDDPVEVELMRNEQKRYLTDVCMFMRYDVVENNITMRDQDAFRIDYRVEYPWYMHLYCEAGGLKAEGVETPHPATHPFMCEYFTYEYRLSKPGDWVYIIAVLGAFVACGFFACAMYCLWDKIHTSYNVLQV